MPPKSGLNKKKVGKPNFHIAIEAMDRPFKPYSTNLLLKAVRRGEDLTFLEERKKPGPTPLRVVVQLRPRIVLFFYSTRLFPIGRNKCGVPMKIIIIDIKV